MPTLPWTVPNRPPQATEVHVFASRFETRTLWGALKFLVRTPRVWRQIRSAPGAYGASLRAEPFRRTFWTLSAQMRESRRSPPGRRRATNCP